MSRGRRPDGRYTGMVVACWPDLEDTDPRRFPLDKAYGLVSTNVDLLADPKGRFLTIADRGVSPMLRITCEPSRHFDGSAPMLAEVWEMGTRFREEFGQECGVLFASKIGGRPGDDPVGGGDPFAPPAFLLPASRRPRTPVGQPAWTPVPVTVVRTFLPPPEKVRLWVKCPQCGTGEIDVIRLNREYAAQAADRRVLDRGQPRVVRILNVGTLYA